MRKAKTLEKQESSILTIIGGLLVAFAVIDFIASFAGVNLTAFLGSASRFSPIVLGLIGGAMMNADEERA